MQHHERGCPILAFFARVGHDAAQGGRRVEQAFQSCVQSHTRLVPSGRTGLQGAKRRLHTQGLGGWPIHAAPRERVPHPRVLCEGGTRCRLRRRGGWSRRSRPAFKATLGLCLPGELACKERSDACTHTGAGGLAHPCSTTREGAPSSRSLRGWDTMPPKEERRVEQAFQSCVQSHTRLVPSGRTGLQGAKRRSRPVRGRARGERESRGRRKERSDACTHSEGAANISPAPRLHRGAKQIGPPEGSPMFSQPKPKAR